MCAASKPSPAKARSSDSRKLCSNRHKYAGVEPGNSCEGAAKKALEHELQQLKTKVAQAQAGDLESQARDIKGVKVLSARVDGFDRAQLRTLVDSLRNKWKTAVVVLGVG